MQRYQVSYPSRPDTHTQCMRLGYRKEFPAPELGVLTCESRKRKQSNKPVLGDGVTECTPPLSSGAAG